jgi:hypothetical protein
MRTSRVISPTSSSRSIRSSANHRARSSFAKNQPMSSARSLVRPLKHLEELPCGRLAKRCDDTNADVLHQRRIPDANVCGHPNVLQIQSHVSKLGDRVPASSSRYSRMLTPSSHAARLSDQPACLRSCSSNFGSIATAGA